MTETPNGHARRQAEKRAEILRIATGLFFEEGYGRTTMDRVLAKVGGSKRTLYNHFQTKDALFTAIVQQVSDRVLAALTPTLDPGDVRQTLIGMGVRYLKVMTSREGISLYRAMVSEAHHFPELAANFLQNGPCRASDQLAEFMTGLTAAGKLRIADPNVAAGQFLGMIRGDAHLKAVLAGTVPTDSEINQLAIRAVESFLRGHTTIND